MTADPYELHELHAATLALVSDFTTAHGRKPSRESQEPGEKNLAEWYERAMVNTARYGNSEWQRVFEMVRELTVFEEAHRRMPSVDAADLAEARLAKWGKRHLRQTYPHPLALRLCAAYGWYGRPKERRVEELQSFVDQHGRLPGPKCRTEAEQSLWRWVRARLDRGTLPPEAQQVVDGAGGYGSYLPQRRALRSQGVR